MKIYTTNTQNDDEFGLAKRVVITSFRQVSIFGKDYTKIVYCHSPESFSVEKVGDNVDPDENVQVIMGPQAEEIITELIGHEKKKGSTFVWSGARFKNSADESLLKEQKKENLRYNGFCSIPLYWDPLVRDFVETEEDRKERLNEARKEEDKANMRRIRTTGKGIIIINGGI